MKALSNFKKGLSISSFKAHSFLFALLLFCSFSSGAVKPHTFLDTLSSQQVWLASQILPGSGQVINRQYWKMPILYAGMGTFAYFGYNANSEYKRMLRDFDPIFYGPEEVELLKEKWELKRIERNTYYAGAALFYFAGVADALLVHSKGKHSPPTATIFSTLVPGLGQIYNGKYWKVPIIYGGFFSLYAGFDYYNRDYKRLKQAYIYRTDDDTETIDEFGNLTTERLAYYKDDFRRNRDLMVICLVALYAMNILDANVDAHLFDWDISDNLALKFEPIYNGDFTAGLSNSNSAYGLKCSYNF